MLIPARPGLTNALGCVVADLRHDFVATVNQPLETLAEGRIAEVFAAQIAAGEALLAARERRRRDAIVTLHRADMQFQGQSHILPVAIAVEPRSRVDALREVFAAAYWKRFGVALPEIKPVLVNLHTAVIGKRKPVSLSAIAAAKPAPTLADARRTTRSVWFADGGWRETPIYVRERLPVAARFDGPAIVEQFDCTTVVEPGQRVALDPIGNLIVRCDGRLNERRWSGIAGHARVGRHPFRPVKSRSVRDTARASHCLRGARDRTPTRAARPALAASRRAALRPRKSRTMSRMAVDPDHPLGPAERPEQVCNEMDLAFVRSAFSPVIAEALDRSDGIYHRDSGELIAQGELGLPVFVGTMQFTVQAVIERVRRLKIALDRATSSSSTIRTSAART